MKRFSHEMIAWLLLPAFSSGVSAQNPELTRRVSQILEQRCTVCHSGQNAAADLDLSRGSLLKATVNVAAAGNRDMRLIQPRDRERSYLLRKVRGDGDVSGGRMPAIGEPLTEEEIAAIIAWIESFPAEWEPGDRPRPERIPADRSDGLFFNSRVGLLPTPDPIGAGIFEFDILHRFLTPIQEAGFGDFYGLDFGANISFHLGYGVTRRLDLGVRRSGARAHWEILSRYRLAEGDIGPVPAALAIQVGYGEATRAGSANRVSWHGQVLLGTRVGDRLTLLLAPSYATRTNPSDDSDEDGTFALGLAGELRFWGERALVVESIPVVSGYQAAHPALTAGIKQRVGGHTFMLLVTNAREMDTDLYLPGGDLDPSHRLRLGFNITRKIY